MNYHRKSIQKQINLLDEIFFDIADAIDYVCEGIYSDPDQTNGSLKRLADEIRTRTFKVEDYR